MSENPTESFDATPTEPLLPVPPLGCDHPTATIDTRTGQCRCLVCARCDKHTGNSNQGHYWAWCSVTRSMRKFHFCCPGDCELEAES